MSLCISDTEKLDKVPALQRKIFSEAGGSEIQIEDLNIIKPDLIIDAVIGYSLKSAPRNNSLTLINWANESAGKILSLDIPSGVDTATGNTPGKFIMAERTLTLALPKTGLLSELTGKLFLADIGIPKAAFEKSGIEYQSPFDKRFIVHIREL